MGAKKLVAARFAHPFIAFHRMVRTPLVEGGLKGRSQESEYRSQNKRLRIPFLFF
jgi:hypothetical protein